MPARFLLTRLLDLVLVLFGISIVVFLMIRLIPGDAVAIMLGANTEVTPDRLAELRSRLGLDLPLHLQYLDWIGSALQGDLGTSIWTGRPVVEEIAANFWPTIELTLLAVLFGAGLSIPLGAFMAQARGKGSELAVRIGAIAGLTIPSFWLGIVSIFLVAKLLPGVAALGYVPFTEDPLGNLQRMILPVIALSLPMLANLSRLVRSAMLDALGQDYVRTARAKGAPRRIVVYKHALRNALIPFVTSVGVSIGYLLGGAIVIEQVFAIPGLGRLVLGAITERNYPLVQATILVITTAFVLVNFFVDLLYAVIDPPDQPRMINFLRSQKLLSFALAFVAVQVLLALLAPWVSPHDPFVQVMVQRMKGPNGLNWLGTDQLGRDVLARILYGYRTSLLTCLTAVGLSLLAGGTLGMLAAFYRGWFDRIVMRLMDVLFAFPIMLLAIGVIAVLGPNMWSAAIAIAVVYTPIFARLLRGPALVICESEYVLGARAIGAGDMRIIFFHLLPNLASVVLVQTSLLLSAAILVEASLSFLGLGAQPPIPSLGLMLSEGRNFLLLSPWPAIFAGFAILFLSFGFNLLGDALRDTLDPRLRGRD